jgi:hypothetical protein
MFFLEIGASYISMLGLLPRIYVRFRVLRRVTSGDALPQSKY